MAVCRLIARHARSLALVRKGCHCGNSLRCWYSCLCSVLQLRHANVRGTTAIQAGVRRLVQDSLARVSPSLSVLLRNMRLQSIKERALSALLHIFRNIVRVWRQFEDRITTDLLGLLPDDHIAGEVCASPCAGGCLSARLFALSVLSSHCTSFLRSRNRVSCDECRPADRGGVVVCEGPWDPHTVHFVRLLPADAETVK